MLLKRILLVVLLCLIIDISFSQDIMVMKNGDEKKVKVTEVLPDAIKFRKWENQDGPIYTEYKTNVFMVKYQNGQKDVFNLTNQQTTQKETPQVSKEEALKNQAITKLEEFFVAMFKQSQDPTLQVFNFKKTNGIMQNMAGTSVYEVEFELAIQFLADAWKVGNSIEGYWGDFKVYRSEPNLRASGWQYTYQTVYFPRGTVYNLGMQATMVNTDNGYVLKHYKVRTTQSLGVRSMQNSYNSISQQQISTASKATKSEQTDNSLYKSFKLFLYKDNENFEVKISDIAVDDGLDKAHEAQSKILDILTSIKRKREKNLRLDTTLNNLALSISANFYYKNFSSDRPNFGAYCNIALQVKNLKTSSIICENSYQLSDIKFLIGFPSQLEAYRDMLSSDKFRNTFIRFINGNFPLTGEIVEIKEKNKKGDEAKVVKINIGKVDNIFPDYKLTIIEEKNGSHSKTSLIVDETFEEYSLCRVVGNSKEIVENFTVGKKIKVKTIIKP